MEKLTIMAYSSEDFAESKKVGEFVVMINPEKYGQGATVKYHDKQPQGIPASEQRFKEVPSEDVSFDFVIDGTGLVIDVPTSQKGKSVNDQITALKDLALEYNGDIHRPNFVMLVWGKFVFKGVMIEMSVQNTLLNPDGEPIRATVTTKFRSTTSWETAASEANINSPDMTHLRTVTAGNTLPLLTEDIYRDPKYYIEVARKNNLNQFRSIKSGTVLKFPPLDQ